MDQGRCTVCVGHGPREGPWPRDGLQFVCNMDQKEKAYCGGLACCPCTALSWSIRQCVSVVIPQSQHTETCEIAELGSVWTGLSFTPHTLCLPSMYTTMHSVVHQQNISLCKNKNQSFLCAHGLCLGSKGYLLHRHLLHKALLQKLQHHYYFEWQIVLMGEGRGKYYA